MHQHVRSQSHRLQKRFGTFAACAQTKNFFELSANGKLRVERSIRILKNHLDATHPLFPRKEIERFFFPKDGSGILPQKAANHFRKSGFPAPRPSDYRELFPTMNLKRNPVER